MKLVDTDILIDHFHGHRAALDFLAKTLSSGEELSISVVTLTELLSGMRPGEESRTERLLAIFTVIGVDETIARQAAQYLQTFRKQARLELADALIAATAALNNAELVTRNEKHYPMTDVTVLVPYQRGQ